MLDGNPGIDRSLKHSTRHTYLNLNILYFMSIFNFFALIGKVKSNLLSNFFRHQIFVPAKVNEYAFTFNFVPLIKVYKKATFNPG